MKLSLRICHISILHQQFDPRIVFRECYTLNLAGYETHLVIPSISGNDEVNCGIFLHNNRTLTDNPSVLNVRERIVRLLRSYRIGMSIKANLFHLHDPELIPVGLLLKLKGKKVIYDSHENNTAYIMQKTYISKPIRKILWIYLYIIETLAARFFDAIVTADVGVKDLYLSRYKAHEVHVLRNFPRLDLFSNFTNSPIKDKPFDIVYHGSIPKNHLVTAFAVDKILRDKHYELRWLFFGVVSDLNWAKLEISNLGITDDFLIDPHFLPVKQVVKRVCQAKIGFIPLPDLPKFHDNIPTKLFEFMALGLPVVMSDLPPSRPFVGDGSGVIMVPPSDYEAYADAIISLIDSPELYSQKSRQGKQKVKDYFNWENESEKLISLYRELIG